ncbi:MAG: hypothetical protein ACLFRF_05600, partial [Desulfobacterales bacterium]
MIAKLFQNPMAKKRYLRFKSMKRAYVSLWILLLLYGLSLLSELICNGVPLYVRFNGESFFPVVKFYSEDVFTGSGRQTRPDYKKIRQMRTFTEDPDNFMIFPPIPFGPLEDIDPADISVSENVKLVLKPEPRVGSVDIEKDYSILRARNFEFFLGPGDKPSEDIRLNRHFSFPGDLKTAIDDRFENKSAAYQSFEILAPSGPVRVVLPTYRP